MFPFHSCPSVHSSKRRRTLSPCTPSANLLPGLPNDLAILCLARVPSLPLLSRVCSSWQAMASRSDVFHSLRASLGFKPQQWIYALLQHPPSDVLDQLDLPVVENRPHPNVSWHAYDPISNFWHCLPPLPLSVDFHLSSPSVLGLQHPIQCVSSATKLFMVAGSRCCRSERAINDIKRISMEPALDCPLIFDTQTKEWTHGAPFRDPRRWCACGEAGGKLMVASGCGQDWDMALSKSAEMYDPEIRKWFKIENLKTSTFSRTALSAVNYKGKLHMVSSVGAIYDPETDRWCDMPRGMKDGWSGQSVVVDGRLLVLEQFSGRLKVYQEDKDEWKCIVAEEEMLKNMEQLAGGVSGTFFGIVRAAPNGSTMSKPEQHSDVIRIVDVRGLKPVVTDLPVPFGQIVTLQVLSRTFKMD